MESFMNPQVMNDIFQKVRDHLDSLEPGAAFKWIPNLESLFIMAMFNLKPVGVHRFGRMILIHERFCSYIGRHVPISILWDKLDAWYDMAALNESEVNPFLQHEVDYALPEDCYDLVKNKFGITLKPYGNESETSKISNNLNALNLKQNTSTPRSSKSILFAHSLNKPMPGTSKTNFSAPTGNKPSKSQTAVKSEIKISHKSKHDLTPYGTHKSKHDLPSFKTHKIKHSSSSSSNKTIKSEHLSATKSDSPDVLSGKKYKSERGSSPAFTKKSMKCEANVINSSSKKANKNESAINGPRPFKEQTPEDSMKKIKSDSDLLKKKKISQSSDSMPLYKKSAKAENVHGIKKRHEHESSPRKLSESSSAKVKVEAKNASLFSREHDMEIPQTSGSKKFSPVVKVKNSDSAKKLSKKNLPEKSPSMEPSSKKSTAGPKRRRIT